MDSITKAKVLTEEAVAQSGRLDLPVAPEALAVSDAFERHQSGVMRQVQRFMRDPDDAYDLALTAWEKAQRAWDRRPVASAEVKPWLFRIARNACVDELRRRQLVHWESLDRREDANDDRPAPIELLASNLCDPLDELLRSERAAFVRLALGRLPVRYRACLLMQEADGLACEEIGKRLGMTAGAVRTTLCRARQRLRDAYLDVSGESLAA